MRQDSSMRESGLKNGEDHQREVFLQMAAYKASHEGRNPPLNSRLWQEHLHLPRGDFGLRTALRFLGICRQEDENKKSTQLKRFVVEKAFLTDDFSLSDVDSRLDQWAMVTDYRLSGRPGTGEWFQYAIDVVADSGDQALTIIECIFSLEPTPQPQSP